jgi:hypothetical protein
MNHLTNIYKHKCEQLQEKVNQLTKMLNEAMPPPKRRKVSVDHNATQGGQGIRQIADSTPITHPEYHPSGGSNAAEAAAHAILLRQTMTSLMHDLRGLNMGTWLDMFEDVFTPIEREAFIALFGEIPVTARGTIMNTETVFVQYTTPNGQLGAMYWDGSWWRPVVKGETPWGSVSSQGFLPVPRQVLNNAPDDFILPKRNPTSATQNGNGGGVVGGGGSGTQTGGPMQ